MARRDELADEQWAVQEPLIPPAIRRSDGRRRLEMHDNRAVLNGILWVLHTGAPWADLPERFPSGSTCFRRFSRWVKEGIFIQILEVPALHLEEVGQIDLSECFIDGTFVLAKKGPENRKNQAGQGYDAHVLPLVRHKSSARTHAVTLVEATLAKTITLGRSERLGGDRACDNEPPDQKLAQMGTELITPHKFNRKRAVSHDGRALRRYKRHWKIE